MKINKNKREQTKTNEGMNEKFTWAGVLRTTKNGNGHTCVYDIRIVRIAAYIVENDPKGHDPQGHDVTGRTSGPQHGETSTVPSSEAQKLFTPLSDFRSK